MPTPLESKKIRFGIVGCGRISHDHLDALNQKNSNGELVAVCDPKADRRAAASEKYNVEGYADYHEMMKNHPEIDVVSVLTPSGLHAEHVIQLASYKKHIIVG